MKQFFSLFRTKFLAFAHFILLRIIRLLIHKRRQLFSCRFRCISHNFCASFSVGLSAFYNMPVEQMQYSEKYYDDFYEYRHVILPPDLALLVPRNHLMTETEWRNLGVQQSPNWVHYMIHNPEPHVLLFRRPKPPDAPIEMLNEVEAHTNTITAV